MTLEVMKNQTKRDEVERLVGVVHDLVDFILQNRKEIYTEIVKDHQLAADRGDFAGKAVPDPREELALRLHEAMPAGGFSDVTVWTGWNVTQKHSWFRVDGDIDLVEDPQMFWLVDPCCRGIRLIRCDTGEIGDILIVEPYSPFNQVYAGRPVEVDE